MIICRALLAIAIVGATIPYAGAQFGGMPGMPGSGMPGGGFGGAPQGPPPKCQALLDDPRRTAEARKGDLRRQRQEGGREGRLQPVPRYIATEAKMIKMLEADGAVVRRSRPRSSSRSAAATPRRSRSASRCATPPRAGPRKPARRSATRSARRRRCPTRSDKKGAGTFETLTGNPFQQR